MFLDTTSLIGRKATFQDIHYCDCEQTRREKSYQEKSLVRVKRKHIGKSYHTLYVIHIKSVRILNTRYGSIIRQSYVNCVEVQSNKKSLIWATLRNQETEPCMESLPKILMILVGNIWLYLSKKRDWNHEKKLSGSVLWISYWLQGASFDSCLRLAMLPA